MTPEHRGPLRSRDPDRVPNPDPDHVPGPELRSGPTDGARPRFSGPLVFAVLLLIVAGLGAAIWVATKKPSPEHPPAESLPIDGDEASPRGGGVERGAGQDPDRPDEGR